MKQTAVKSLLIFSLILPLLGMAPSLRTGAETGFKKEASVNWERVVQTAEKLLMTFASDAEKLEAIERMLDRNPEAMREAAIRELVSQATSTFGVERRTASVIKIYVRNINKASRRGDTETAQALAQSLNSFNNDLRNQHEKFANLAASLINKLT